MLHLENLEELGRLEDGWDGEGAPKPLPSTILRASTVVRWAHDRGITNLEIDADVLGGMAVTIFPPDSTDRKLWFSLLNSHEHQNVAVWTDGDNVGSTRLDVMREAELDNCVKFLELMAKIDFEGQIVEGSYHSKGFKGLYVVKTRATKLLPLIAASCSDGHGAVTINGRVFSIREVHFSYSTGITKLDVVEQMT